MRRPAQLYAELDALADQLDELTRQMMDLEGAPFDDMLIGDESSDQYGGSQNSEYKQEIASDILQKIPSPQHSIGSKKPVTETSGFSPKRMMTL